MTVFLFGLQNLIDSSKRGRGPRFKSEQAHLNKYKMKSKRLYRSKKDRILGGVCGGIAEYLEADSTIIRLIWAVGTLVSVGFGILAYLIAWIIIPER